MFKKQNKKDEDKLIYSTTSLLLKVASADQVLKKEELSIVKEIICDFFTIRAGDADKIIS